MLAINWVLEFTTRPTSRFFRYEGEHAKKRTIGFTDSEASESIQGSLPSYMFFCFFFNFCITSSRLKVIGLMNDQSRLHGLQTSVGDRAVSGQVSGEAPGAHLPPGVTLLNNHPSQPLPPRPGPQHAESTSSFQSVDARQGKAVATCEGWENQ